MTPEHDPGVTVGVCIRFECVIRSGYLHIFVPTSNLQPFIKVPISIICEHPSKANVNLVVMLLSHCGEYMANGLTNAVRHEFVMIANDRQTFVAVRKHSRSFLWCFEWYAGLTSGECMANGPTNAIRHQFAMIAK